MSFFAGIQAKVVDYYQTKNDNEQKLLLVLAVFLPLFAVYSIVSTVNQGLESTRDKLEKQIDLNEWAAQQIAVIHAAKGKPSSTSQQGSITQLINASARKYGVTIARLQPQKTDSVRVGIEEVSFNKFTSWLSELENRHGIKVASVDFSRADASGRVKIRRLDLERS